MTRRKYATHRNHSSRANYLIPSSLRILACTIRTRTPLADASWNLPPPSSLLARFAKTVSRLNQELLNHHTINIPSPNIGGAIDREKKNLIFAVQRCIISVLPRPLIRFAAHTTLFTQPFPFAFQSFSEDAVVIFRALESIVPCLVVLGVRNCSVVIITESILN